MKVWAGQVWAEAPWKCLGLVQEEQSSIYSLMGLVLAEKQRETLEMPFDPV